MKNETLIELAKCWVSEAETTQLINGAEDAKIDNARQEGRREAKRECSDALILLVNIFKG